MRGHYQSALNLVKLILVGLSNRLAVLFSASSSSELIMDRDCLGTGWAVRFGPFLFDPESQTWVNVAHPRSRGSLKVGKKLYVGNLSFSVTNADLEDLFAPYGEVRSAQVVEDRQTGRSRGFGFVEMGNDTEALAAIDALHDQEHGGRRLTVNEAKPREDRGSGGYRGGGGGGSYRGGGDR